MGRRRAGRSRCAQARNAGGRARRRRHRLVPRPLDGGGQGIRPARSRGGRELRARGGGGRRAPHRLSRRPRAARRRFRAPRVAQGDGRSAARILGAGHRSSRGHHRRTGLGGVRGDARPRLPPAGDGDAQVGAVEVVADRAVEPARVPAEGGDAARSRRTGLRRGRARVHVVRGHDAAVRRGRRQAAAHPARTGAVAAAVVVLARPRHRGPGEHRARADRRTEARHPRARRRAAPARAPDAADVPAGRRGGARRRAAQRGGGALDRGRAHVPRVSSRPRVLREARERAAPTPRRARATSGAS